MLSIAEALNTLRFAHETRDGLKLIADCLQAVNQKEEASNCREMSHPSMHDTERTGNSLLGLPLHISPSVGHDHRLHESEAIRKSYVG